MDQNKPNHILVIGGPNAGKTHYGGQLYGRLMDRSGFYSITTPPKDLTVFREVLECLNNGKSAGHTSVGSNARLELALEDKHKNQIIFSFPDYGGEQVQKIVNERKITQTWQGDINKCNSWMLFIRLDEILPVEDIVNRPPDASILHSRRTGEVSFKLSEQAFFVDLIQILLQVKGTSTHKRVESPRLTIVLSCWDLLPETEKKLLPYEALQLRMPMLYSYLVNSWNDTALNVIGLSSTGKTLSAEFGDKDYIKKGPEAFGYLITSQGKEEKDLTITIATAIGRF